MSELHSYRASNWGGVHVGGRNFYWRGLVFRFEEDFHLVGLTHSVTTSDWHFSIGLFRVSGGNTAHITVHTGGDSRAWLLTNSAERGTYRELPNPKPFTPGNYFLGQGRHYGSAYHQEAARLGLYDHTGAVDTLPGISAIYPDGFTTKNMTYRFVTEVQGWDLAGRTSTDLSDIVPDIGMTYMLKNHGFRSLKVGGTWRDVSDSYVKVDGTWRGVANVYVKINGVWRRAEFD